MYKSDQSRACVSETSRTGISRISPIEGPPKHRKISADEPPSSETGRTNAGEDPKAETKELAPVPPDMMRYVGARELIFVRDVLAGRCTRLDLSMFAAPKMMNRVIRHRVSLPSESAETSDP